jgi:hypothetical protein
MDERCEKFGEDNGQTPTEKPPAEVDLVVLLRVRMGLGEDATFEDFANAVWHTLDAGDAKAAKMQEELDAALRDAIAQKEEAERLWEVCDKQAAEIASLKKYNSYLKDQRDEAQEVIRGLGEHIAIITVGRITEWVTYRRQTQADRKARTDASGAASGDGA